MKSQSPKKSNPHFHASEILNRRRLSEKVFEIELTRPPSFEFIPGQRISLIHETLERDYSLISTPMDPILAFCIRKVEEGIFSPILASMDIGTPLSFTGPHGYFIFRLSRRPAVFIATGTGIAPFVSMGRSGSTGFTLLHGVRMPEDLYYESFFRGIAKHYVPCLSAIQAETPQPHDAFRGRVTDYLERQLTSGSYDFYLCGRRDMIRDVTHIVDERFPGSFIYTEIYY